MSEASGEMRELDGDPDAGPIFVAGADRSGTTLMSAILGAHPAIAVPTLGTNMWTFFHGQFGRLDAPENLEACLGAMLRYKNVRGLEPDLDALRLAFRAGPPTYDRLFALILDQFAARAGKRRWADKTSYVERYVGGIVTARPDARFIHMIRDPRDRFASAIRRWPSGHGQLGGGTARWLYSVGLARANRRRLGPERYLLVRFESLLAEPEATVRGICDFLGEPYEPRMLDFAGIEPFRARGGNSSFDNAAPGAISTAPIGRYASTLTPGQVRFIELYAGRTMEQLDYAAARPPLGLRGGLRYGLVTLPLDSARLAGWLALEAIQQRLPRFAGRSPATDRVVDGGAT
jgi:hypothetical protein